MQFKTIVNHIMPHFIFLFDCLDGSERAAKCKLFNKTSLMNRLTHLFHISSSSLPFYFYGTLCK